MNDNTEVRDELARLAGYEKRQCENETGLGSPFYYAWFKDGKPDGDFFNGHRPHPIPNTLDEAAKLPEGWVYDYVDFCLGPIVACAKKNGEHVHGEGPTELAARFALRLAVEKIEHERRGGQP